MAVRIGSLRTSNDLSSPYSRSLRRRACRIISGADPEALRQWARSFCPDAETFARTGPEQLSDIVLMPWLQRFAEQLSGPLQAPTLASSAATR
jgi:hypothetical protein